MFVNHFFFSFEQYTNTIMNFALELGFNYDIYAIMIVIMHNVR